MVVVVGDAFSVSGGREALEKHGSATGKQG